MGRRIRLARETGTRLSGNMKLPRMAPAEFDSCVFLARKHVPGKVGIISRVVFYVRHGATDPSDARNWALTAW